MTLTYYPETDSLYVELRPDPGIEAVEISDGLVADLDAAGAVVGFDIDHASTCLDLSRIEVVDLPHPSRRRAPAPRAQKKQES